MGADVVLVLLLAGGFVLGFFRGVIRQLLLFAAWAVIFVIAAYLRVPLGEWLASSSPQFSGEYPVMLSFLALFGTLFVGALLLVEFGGGGSSLTRHPLIDDVLGGLMGLAIAAVFIASIIVILNSYFLRAGATPQAGELSWLRDIHSALDESVVAQVIREWIVRGMSFVLGPLLPADLRTALA